MRRFYFFNSWPLIIALLFFGLFSYQSLRLFQAHRTRGDLTNFAQAMWNSTQGRLMQNTFNYSVHNFWGDRQAHIPLDSNIFGIHFNPILFGLLPFYSIYPHPQTLLILQAVLIALSGVIMFSITLHITKSRLFSYLIEISFLTYFPLVSAVLSEFHAYSLSIFFGSLLIYSSLKNSPNYYLALLAFLFVQENTAIISIFYGFYLATHQTTRKIGIVTSIVSLLYFVITLKLLIPALSNYGHYLFENAYGSPLGQNISQIIINSLKNPFLLISTLTSPENIQYLTRLLLPLGPAIIMSPLLLLVSLSGLATNLLSSAPILKSQLMHYDALAIPWLFLTLIYGSHQLTLHLKKWHYRLPFLYYGLYLLITIYTSYIFTTPRIGYQVLRQNLYQPSNRDLDSLISQIPPHASVSTADYISGHLSQRRGLYLFPVNATNSDYILVSTTNTWPLSSTESQQIINHILDHPQYQVMAQKNDLILIKRTSSNGH